MAPGETETDVPEPTNVPPHEPLYQRQTPPAPKEPPLTVRVEEPPEQTEVGVAEAEVGDVEMEFTVTLTLTLTQDVVLQVPSALTKYVVVAAGETEIEAPVPTSVPPQEPLYHCHAPTVPKDPPFTVNVEELPEHIEVGLAVADEGATELLFTVTVTLAQVVLPQVPSALTK